MLSRSKSYWGGVCCTTERDKAAVLSWFSFMCEDMVPESCEELSDAITGTAKKIRAVMIHKNGRKFLATRTFGKRTFSIRLTPMKSIAA